MRPTEIPTAEVYRHEVPGDRPAAGGDDCLPGGHRQGGHTWDLQIGEADRDQFGRGKGRQLVIFRVGATYVFFRVCLGRNQINERTQDSYICFEFCVQ